MSFNRFSIYQQVDPEPPVPIFRIIEKSDTIDGPRSRICETPYRSLDEAKHAIQEFQS